MAATARSIRSSASTQSRPQSRPQAPSRPELKVISGQRVQAEGNMIERVIEWTRTRSAPLMHVVIAIVIAIVFLMATLLGALVLRTQMVQNSFKAAAVKQHISTLTQDVEDDQAKLDQLVASLPDKADEMGMVSQGGSVTIDLNGYQQSGESGAQ